MSLSSPTRDALLAQASRALGSGDLAGAERSIRLVLQSIPNDAEAIRLWGIVALAASNPGPAVTLLERAFALARPSAETAQLAAIACVGAGRLGDARGWFGRALSIEPAHVAALQGLALLEQRFLRHAEARRLLAAAADLAPSDSAAVGNLLLALHFDSDLDSAALFAEHQRRATALVGGIEPRRWTPPGAGDAERRLVVGLFSPALDGDIVGHFLLSFLPHLDRSQISLRVYSGSRRGVPSDDPRGAHVPPSPDLARVRALADDWRDVGETGDEELASCIAADGVDVLVDLAGHTPGNRLRVLARKPAPVIVEWLDWFDTTGISAVDALLGDPVSTPLASPQRYAERIVRLPHVRLCYAPPAQAPAVVPAPGVARGHVTFGSFNRIEKLNEPLLALWAAVLREVPDARMLLKAAALSSPEVRDHLHARFAALGVERGRVELRPATAFGDMLAEYGEIDIALDPTPYNGGATTCHALMMGVPVLALAGERLIARQSASFLRAAGLGEWIAEDAGDYVRIAVERAADRSGLAELRGGLRQCFIASPACDGAAFARDFEQALRGLWREYCSSDCPGSTHSPATCAMVNADRDEAPAGRPGQRIDPPTKRRFE